MARADAIAIPPTSVGDLGRFGWEVHAPDGSVAVRGMDIALVADARITRLWVFVEGP